MGWVWKQIRARASSSLLSAHELPANITDHQEYAAIVKFQEIKQTICMPRIAMTILLAAILFILSIPTACVKLSH